MADEETVRVLLGWHVTAQDAFASFEHMRWCDIFVPELAGWTPSTETANNMVASGALSALDLLKTAGDAFDSFSAAQLMLLEGTRKRVLFADLPDGHPLAETLVQLNRLIKTIPDAPQPWDMAVRALTLVIQRFAEGNIEREAYIAERIAEMVAEFPAHRILVRVGAAHSAVARLLRATGVAARNVLVADLRRFGTEAQAYRYAQYGKPIPALAIARIFLEELLHRYWLPEGVYLDPDARDGMLWRVMLRFTEEEIAALWESFTRGELDRRSMHECIARHGFMLDSH